MSRCVRTLAMCAVLLGGMLSSADDDPVGAKLAGAKAEYAKDLEKARGVLVGELKKKAETAQKAGNLKALEMIEEEIKALEDKGDLPKSVPTTGYDSDVRRGRAKLGDAYAEAVKGYTKDGKRAQAKAVQQDLDEFKKGDATKVGDGPKADPLEVGTKWKGIATLDNKNKLTAVVTVIERSEKAAKLSISFEGGAVWTFECTTNGQSLQIKGAEREKVADANAGRKDLQTVGGTTGKGDVAGAKMTLSYTVPAGNGKPAVIARVVAEREK
jgi:hypothetical protein